MANPQISLVNLPVMLTDRQARNLIVKNNESDHARTLVMGLLNKSGRDLLDSLYNPAFAKNLLSLSNSVDTYVEYLQNMHQLALQARDRCTLLCQEHLKIQNEGNDHDDE